MATVVVPNEIIDLIDYGIASNQRSVFVVVGAKAETQIQRMYALYTKQKGAARRGTVRGAREILWCYLDSNPISRFSVQLRRNIKKKRFRAEQSADDASLSTFLAQNHIEFMKYSDMKRTEGKTYEMLVLSSFDSISPDTLARAVETVTGGGIIFIALDKMTALRQLEDLVNGPGPEPVGHATELKDRYSSRFTRSLLACPTAAFITDEWSVLSGVRPLVVPDATASIEAASKRRNALTAIKAAQQVESMSALLCGLCATPCQARAVTGAIAALGWDDDDEKGTEMEGKDKKKKAKAKHPRLCLAGPRGRGKGVALGLLSAAAVKRGLGFVAITAPSPAAVQTALLFAKKGLEALGYAEHTNFTATVEGTIVTGLAVSAGTAQTVAFVPADKAGRVDAELVLVAEAASIPQISRTSVLSSDAPLIATMTTAGYHTAGSTHVSSTMQFMGPTVFELQTPARFNEGDGAERWVSKLLALEGPVVAAAKAELTPDQCSLFEVNLDTLLKAADRPNSVTEVALATVMGLLRSYDLTICPTDVQQLADGPTERLFILVDPRSFKKTLTVPVAIRVSLEGAIRRGYRSTMLSDNKADNDESVPYQVGSTYREMADGFSLLSGARVLRLASTPGFEGFEKRAVDQLIAFYSGDLKCEVRPESAELLSPCSAIEPEDISWVAATTDATEPDLCFWREAGLKPVFLTPLPQSTGVHGVTMIAQVGSGAVQWAEKIAVEFRHRLAATLATPVLRQLPLETVYRLMDMPESLKCAEPIKRADLIAHFTPGGDATDFGRDIARLRSYTAELVHSYQSVADLVPQAASLATCGRLTLDLGPEPHTMCCVLVALGLQQHDFEDAAQLVVGLRAPKTRPEERVSVLRSKAKAMVKMLVDGLDEETRKAAATAPEKRACE
ncbi:Helicase [Carpediemonas membranifera]|uniref:Helicase n=1 Tax=Carpediemonas membranifera TaxID=201153 RepID=A0A8J6C051_9EUKA|nr:Helicase [Carpediemonas membranifera]|eukprot:KAG9396216.1 Helicase [Carpediemonas membranifera]